MKQLKLFNKKYVLKFTHCYIVGDYYQTPKDELYWARGELSEATLFNDRKEAEVFLKKARYAAVVEELNERM